MNETRLGGWSGVVFSVLSLAVVPLSVSPPPALGASQELFAEWYAAHHWGFLVGNYLGMAAFFPGFVQLAVLVARIQRIEGKSGWLAPLVLATGTFAYAVFFCSLVAFQVLPFLAGTRQTGAMEAMSTLGALWFSLDGLAAFPFVLAVGLAVVRTKALPRWVAGASWLTAALALLMSFGGLTATPAWLAAGGWATFIGFVVFFGWITALSVLFVRLRE